MLASGQQQDPDQLNSLEPLDDHPKYQKVLYCTLNGAALTSLLTSPGFALFWVLLAKQGQ